MSLMWQVKIVSFQVLSLTPLLIMYYLHLSSAFLFLHVFVFGINE